MRPDDATAAYLWDALTRARSIQKVLRDVAFTAYQDDVILAAATERFMEVLGEALGNLRRTAPDTARAVPDLHRIVGMRNVLVHGYAEVNDLTVWTAATINVPALIPVLEALLAEHDPPADLVTP